MRSLVPSVCVLWLFSLAVGRASVAQDPPREVPAPPARDEREASEAVRRHLALLSEGLRARDERKTIEALGLLARYPGDPRVVPAIVRALDRKSPVGRDAARHLGALGDPRATPALAARLRKKSVREDHARVRAMLGALGAIGDKRAVKPLLKEIQAREPSIALAAISAVTRVKTERRRVVDRLIARLESAVSRRKSESDARRIQALAAEISALAGAINTITGQSFVANPTAIRRWWKKHRKSVPDRLPPPKDRSPDKPATPRK